MIVGREILRRYPPLREAWPVRRARAWRAEREQRLHPRFMASWFRDAPDMSTRLCLSNLELPEAPDLCRPVTVSLSLFDQSGLSIGEQRYRLARNGSLVVELATLLAPDRRGRLLSGQVRIAFEGPDLGSSRAYLHWYNDHSLTSSHEKFGLTIPAVAGYWTVPNAQDRPTYRTHLALVNLDCAPYSSQLSLKAADGRVQETAVELPVNGSRFLGLSEMFPDAGAYLGHEPGILYFGNNRQPAMYYYFVANSELGTWRAQHL